MAVLRHCMVLAAAAALHAAGPLAGSAGAEGARAGAQAAGLANMVNVRVRPAATVAFSGPLVACESMSPEQTTTCGSSRARLSGKPADASDDVVTGSTGPRPMVECSLFTKRLFERCSE